MGEFDASMDFSDVKQFSASEVDLQQWARAIMDMLEGRMTIGQLFLTTQSVMGADYSKIFASWEKNNIDLGLEGTDDLPYFDDNPPSPEAELFLRGWLDGVLRHYQLAPFASDYLQQQMVRLGDAETDMDEVSPEDMAAMPGVFNPFGEEGNETQDLVDSDENETQDLVDWEEDEPALPLTQKPSTFYIVDSVSEEVSRWNFSTFDGLDNALRDSKLQNPYRELIKASAEAERNPEALQTVLDGEVMSVYVTYDSRRDSISVTCRLLEPSGNENILNSMQASPMKNGKCYYVQFGKNILLSMDKNKFPHPSLAAHLRAARIETFMEDSSFPGPQESDIGTIERVWKIGKGKDWFRVKPPQSGSDRGPITELIRGATGDQRVIRFISG